MLRRFGRRLDLHFLEIEITGDFFDDFFRDGFGVFDEGADQGMLAKQIGEPRNVAGVAMYDFNCRWTEDLSSPALPAMRSLDKDSFNPSCRGELYFLSLPLSVPSRASAEPQASAVDHLHSAST